MSLYHTLLAAVLDLLAVGPLSEQEMEGAQDDALSRTRFAGNDGEARVEVDF